jgi:L-threonylcarbamoyladenylate synthase
LVKDSKILLDLIEHAVAILEEGGVIAFPTETVYGLGASIAKPEAAKRVFQIKGRDFKKALPLVLSDIPQINDVAISVPKTGWQLIEKFWPGPLTLVVLKKPIIPYIITAGADTVAVRVSSNSIAREIVRKLGVPITGTSANISGKPSPATAMEVREQLHNKIDLIIDGGKCGGVESTIVDVTQDIPLVLREGAISIEAIRDLGIKAKKQVQENKK